ncbi:hypothetical protein ENUP19_0317G0078 [Entamoeba nuttalli]|uniref:Ribonuclease P protein subunit p30, putative n=2 Tax=Entamoeba nuttalli TaxID=412467 RepID=K2GV64_ENTNP|nr:ribonuclease P protein subunit p30, putative [Entamoeba nuttalli P19]EKE37712.1 ribonuclease P protein subunit p30, putative [Entamoeba nuttalli P19]|eukprot:XP_008859958.1 ribonuclease P protein subunit p30, putative [Entamoeba nuttalli P19]
MADCCVEYSENGYNEISQSPLFNEFRYVIFAIKIKENRLFQEIKPPKYQYQTNLPSGEYSLLPSHKQLTRASFIVSNLQTLHSLVVIGKSFDLVSVEPTNERAFNETCSLATTDIITLDFLRYSFYTNINAIRTALTRGIFFEIKISSLSSIKNGNLRSQIFSNIHDFIILTKARNLILSSGATSLNSFKSLRSLQHFGRTLGLTPSQSYDAICSNPMRCITRSRKRNPINCLVIV